MNKTYEKLQPSIEHALNELVKFWFSNPNLWFNSTPENDKLISDKYGYLIDEQFSNDDSSLGLIIIYDQIVRHVYRDQKDIILFYSALALKHVNTLMLDIEKYSPDERCFILLPLRHTFIEGNINFCIDCVNKWSEDNDAPIYNRFYQASVQSLSRINSSKPSLTTFVKKDTNYESILDSQSIKEIVPACDLDIYDEPLYKEFCKNMISISHKNIIVSLSGGVDSMVCAFLLHYYAKKTNINPIAATINYANREEQYLEIEMVNEWLSYLDIEHHVRVIDEIKRSRDKHRDFYEKITREIRFELYQKLNGSVILGHNKDDSIENIFSNIKKKKSYDNLLGMSIFSQEKNVDVYRPLLNISKKEIIEFAIKYRIPFVYDSTPSWSERGRMRDILIPQINSFDKDIIDGLLELSSNFKEIHKIYKISNIPDITFEETQCTLVDPKIYFFDYWKNIMNVICSHYNIHNIKNKGIQNMIDNFKNQSRITLSKNIICKQTDNTITFYLIST